MLTDDELSTTKYFLGKVKTYLKSPLRLIAESQECRDDVLRVCGSTKFNPSNNFDVLLCLTNSQDVRQCVIILAIVTFPLFSLMAVITLVESR